MSTAIRPLRVAIVGAGPSGLYAAGHLLRQHERKVEVDVFERLPTPWGLVRAGVAPDHPEKKGVTRVFELTACLPGFRLFGNVEIGRHLQPAQLHAWYDAVIYAYGASGSRPAGLPGESLPGCSAATDFVGWYNGHPDFADRRYDFSAERAIVVGNGNVSLDVARMLCLPNDELGRTDIADHALRALAGSRIREVVVIGRRSALHAAFNNPELSELGDLHGVDVVVAAEDLPTEEQMALARPDWETRRKIETLRQFSQRPRRHPRSIHLRFLATPVEATGSDRVSGLKLERNHLTAAGGELTVTPGGEFETLSAGLVLFAIGFKGKPLADLPFDPKAGIVPNQDGRVMGLTNTYVTGWIARGPSGIIGSNKRCAGQAVRALLDDVDARPKPFRELPNRHELARRIAASGAEIVDFGDWQEIDDCERDGGQRQGRPRLKMTGIDDMLRAVNVARGETA